MTIEALCLIFSCSIIADTYLSFEWTSQGGLEGNPLWARAMKRPALVITLDFSIMAGFNFGIAEVAKHDKPLAIGIAVAACLVQGFWLYQHYRVRRR